MANYLSPGVYVEQVSNAPQVTTGVSTSTMAIVGWTLQGPTNDATLITSPNQFNSTFGAYTAESLVPLSVSAFFQNGGSRCYVVRVVPSDAEAATGGILSAVTGVSLTPVSTGATPQTFTATLVYVPVTPGSATITWKKTGSVITTEAQTPSPAPNGTLLGPFTMTLAHPPVTNDNITINWTETSVTKTATLSSTNVIGGANAANLTSASLTRTTGVLVVTFAAGHPPDASSITVTYTEIGVSDSVTDNGSGTFTGTGVTGTINYTTGAVSVTITGSTFVPYNGDTVTMVYSGDVWGLTAANPGAWGNDLQVTLDGNPNFFVYGTPSTANVGTYSRFDVTISQLNANGVYEVQETYNELVFNNASDPAYFPDVINNASELLKVTDLGFLNAPASFSGTSYLAEVIGAGTGSTRTFTYTVENPPVVKTSPVIHYTISAVPYTASASTLGIITGTNIDTTKTNTINYTTGAITLNFLTAPDNSTNVTIDYVSMPANTSVNYNLTGGSDGTVSSINETIVSNFNDLAGTNQGMYALNLVDEMMQLIIPDFAGNTSVMTDMVAYAASRGDIFCIFATPSGMTAQEAADFQQITFNQKSEYAAMYWPWVVVQNPLSSLQTLTVPPLGHIAGIYARTDNNKNVSKAPAGTVDGALLGILGLERNPTQGDRDTVYPARVNPLINTPGTGLAVWGARTMTPLTDATIYIQAVRLFMFVSKSLLNSMQNYIFESISGSLYNTIKTQCNTFLINLYNQGYFAGSSPSAAFQVICDISNNPISVQDQGQVIVDVGIAPTKPAEFLIIRISQLAGS
jgi:phage tail sheath protein FI